MRFIQYLLILILIFQIKCGIPEFKQGTYDYIETFHIVCTLPSKFEKRTVDFGTTFSQVPQIALGVYSYDFTNSAPFGVQITLLDASETGFTFQASYTGRMWFRLPIYWYAFVDSSIEIVEFKLDPVSTSTNSIAKLNKLAVVGILLLNGFYSPTTHPNFYAEVTAADESSFTVDMHVTGALSWVSYYAILGYSLSLWKNDLATIVPIYNYQVAAYPLTITFPLEWQLIVDKFAIITLNGVDEDLTKNQELSIQYILSDNDIKVKIGQSSNSNIALIHYQIALYRKIVTEQSCQVIPFPELPHVILELI